MVVPSGFEPEQAEPKSAVLPLHHGTGKSAGKCIKKIYPKKYIVQEWLVPTAITASGSYFLRLCSNLPAKIRHNF